LKETLSPADSTEVLRTLEGSLALPPLFPPKYQLVLEGTEEALPAIDGSHLGERFSVTPSQTFVGPMEGGARTVTLPRAIAPESLRFSLVIPEAHYTVAGDTITFTHPPNEDSFVTWRAKLTMVLVDYTFGYDAETLSQTFRYRFVES
jgi:hypothetical protein